MIVGLGGWRCNASLDNADHHDVMSLQISTAQAQLLAKRLNLPYFETGYIQTPSPSPSPTPGQDPSSGAESVAAARQLIDDAPAWMKGQLGVTVSPRRLLQHVVLAHQTRVSVSP